MAGKEVIRAAQLFTKNGRASQVSVVKEITLGMVFGIAAGMVWQTYHWNETAKWESFYKNLDEKRAA